MTYQEAYEDYLKIESALHGMYERIELKVEKKQDMLFRSWFTATVYVLLGRRTDGSILADAIRCLDGYYITNTETGWNTSLEIELGNWK